MPTEDQRAFADVARRSFAACADLDAAAIAARLADDGLLSMLAPEKAGGLGLGVRAAVPVARAAGRHLLAFPLVEAIIATAFAGHHSTAGELDARGFATIAWSSDVTLTGDRLTGLATRAPLANAASRLLLPAVRDGRTIAALVDLGVGATITRGPEFDLDRAYCDVMLHNAALIGIGEHWSAVAHNGAILRAADMLGAAEASFEDACAHVSTRRQFGKPLSAQQTVSAALARDHFALTGAALSIEYAALAADQGAGDAANACDVACAVAADAAIAAAENAIQLHGALGFTWAMPLHRRLRRIQAAADIYGAKAARSALADRVLGAWVEAA